MSLKKRIEQAAARTKIGRRAVEEPRYRVILAATLTLVLNLGYGLWHGIVGWMGHSWWFIALSAYYTILGMTRFAAVLCERKQGNTQERDLESFVMRMTGVLLLLLSCVLAGVNYMSLTQDRASQYGQITMITIATFTFGKLAMAVVRMVKHRTDPSALLAAIRGIGYAEVAVSLLTLQRSMLVSFGEMDPNERNFMNALTGTGVYLFVIALGIGLIRGRRWKGCGKVKAGKGKQKNRGSRGRHL